MKKLVIILIVLVSIVLFNNLQTSEVPKWITDFEPMNDCFYGIGKAESRRISIISALSELYYDIRNYEESFNESSKSSDINLNKPINIGDVTIKSLTKKWVQTEQEELTVSISMEKGKNSLEYKHYFMKKSGITKEFILNIKEKGFCLKDLIDELKDKSCTVKSYTDGTNFFTLVKCKKKIITKE